MTQYKGNKCPECGGEIIICDLDCGEGIVIPFYECRKCYWSKEYEQ